MRGQLAAVAARAYPRRMDSLVSTDWLAEHLGEPDLVVVDASWHMPAHRAAAGATSSRSAYPRRALSRHRRGERPANAAPHMLPTAAEFGRAMERLGTGRDDRIIVYDNPRLRTAARGWFMFRHFGAERVAILDGGLQRWLAEGRPIESGEPRRARRGSRPGSAARSSPSRRSSPGLAFRGSMPGASPRFEGSEADPRPGVAPGHAPGARNLPFSSLYREDGRSGRSKSFAVVRRGGRRPGKAVRRQLRVGSDCQQPDLRGAPNRQRRGAACMTEAGANGAPTRRPRRCWGRPSAEDDSGDL